MKRASILIILWTTGLCGCLSAQVKGVVCSDKGESLAGAMVKAVDADGGVLAYAIADNEGRYTIQTVRIKFVPECPFSCGILGM